MNAMLANAANLQRPAICMFLPVARVEPSVLVDRMQSVVCGLLVPWLHGVSGPIGLQHELLHRLDRLLYNLLIHACTTQASVNQADMIAHAYRVAASDARQDSSVQHERPIIWGRAVEI